MCLGSLREGQIPLPARGFYEERHEGGMSLGIKDGSLNLDCKIE